MTNHEIVMEVMSRHRGEPMTTGQVADEAWPDTPRWERSNAIKRAYQTLNSASRFGFIEKMKDQATNGARYWRLAE